MLLFLFTSCEKENIDTIDITTEPTEASTRTINNLIGNVSASTVANGLELGCITINYSFDVVLTDNTVVTVSSDADLEEYLDPNPSDSIFIADFVYPLEVVDADGNTVTAVDAEALGVLFGACVPDEGWVNEGFPAFIINLDEYCIALQYPVTVVDQDDNETTVNSEGEFADALASNQFLVFVFPLDVIDADGVTTTIENDEALFNAMLDCEQFNNPCDSIVTGGGDIACYTLQFPVTVILTDSSIVTVNNENGFFDLLLNGDISGFTFPLSLISFDGELIVVNNEIELQEALEDCGDIPININDTDVFSLISGTLQGCFSINYPMNILLADGSEVEITSEQELFDAMSGGPANTSISISYPVSVTLIEGGQTIEISELTELIDILANCG